MAKFIRLGCKCCCGSQIGFFLSNFNIIDLQVSVCEFIDEKLVWVICAITPRVKTATANQFG